MDGYRHECHSKAPDLNLGCINLALLIGGNRAARLTPRVTHALIAAAGSKQGNTMTSVHITLANTHFLLLSGCLRKIIAQRR